MIIALLTTAAAVQTLRKPAHRYGPHRRSGRRPTPTHREVVRLGRGPAG